jgi:hypothetical protein
MGAPELLASGGGAADVSILLIACLSLTVVFVAVQLARITYFSSFPGKIHEDGILGAGGSEHAPVSY